MKKHLFLLALSLCLLTLGACEKAILEEDDDKTETPTTPSDDNGDDGDDNGGSDDGSTNDNDSTFYPEPGTKDSEETDIIDGNEDNGGNENPPTTSELIVQGERAYTVTEFLNQSFSRSVWVVGYVVGDCTKKHENANYNPPFRQPQAILIADDTLNIDENHVMSVKLSSQTYKDTYSLSNNPGKYHKRLAICGYRGKNYLGFSSFDYPLSSIEWYD